MKSDELLLLAYVNGELQAQEREDVERMLVTSPDLAQEVVFLRASQLPYREAFAQQKLPPVPPSLTLKIEEMAREAARKTPAPAQSANDPIMPPVPGSAPSVPVRSKLRIAPVWLAVAFVAGAFVCNLSLRVISDGSTGVGGAASIASNESEGARPWVVAAAGYQQLYARRTLENVSSDAALSEKTLEQIHREDGLALTIPDLSSMGLTFKRVQRLRFGKNTLVQIVYLPKEGAPVALCVMKEASADEGVKTQRVASMDVAAWRQGNLGYALIAQPDGVDLGTLGKAIATRQFAPLFS